jgi:hypothetical protein
MGPKYKKFTLDRQYAKVIHMPESPVTSTATSIDLCKIFHRSTPSTADESFGKPPQYRLFLWMLSSFGVSSFLLIIQFFATRAAAQSNALHSNGHATTEQVPKP